MLGLLGGAADARAAETDLVMTLGFDQFELAKELLANRAKIVWCTRLSRAQVRAAGAAASLQLCSCYAQDGVGRGWVGGGVMGSLLFWVRCPDRRAGKGVGAGTGFVLAAHLP